MTEKPCTSRRSFLSRVPGSFLAASFSTPRIFTGELIWETRFPELRHILRRNLLFHNLNCIGRGSKSRLGKTIQKNAHAEEMIAVPMSCIDGSEIFPLGGDPIGLSASLRNSNEGIDQ